MDDGEPMENNFWVRLHKLIIILSSLVLLTVGLMGLIGWHLQNERLTTLIFDSESIRYNVSLLFLLSGIALFYQLFGSKRFNLPRYLGLFIGIIGLLVLMEYLLTIDFKIDSFFSDLLIKNKTWKKVGRPSLFTAMVFTAAGMAFSLFSIDKVRRQSCILRVTMGLLVFAIGVFGLLSFILPFELNLFHSSWYRKTSLLGALGSFWLGLGICSGAAYDTYKCNIRLKNIKSILTGSVLIFITCLASLGLFSAKMGLLSQFLDARLELIRVTLANHFNKQLTTFSSFNKHLDTDTKIFPPEPWIDDAEFYLSLHPEFHVIYLIDGTYNIKAIIPKQMEKNEINTSYNVSSKTKKNLETLTYNQYLFQYDPIDENLIVFSRIKSKELIFFVTAANVSQFFTSVLTDVGKNLDIEIYNKKNLIFELNETPKTHPFFTKKTVIHINGLDLTIKIHPSPFLVAKVEDMKVVIIIFLSGIIFGTLAAVLVGMIERDETHIHEITTMKETLDEYKTQIDLAIQGAGIATLTYDVKSKQGLWDEYAYATVFGADKGFILPTTIETLLQLIHPEDRSRFAAEFAMTFKKKSVLFSPHRILRPDGTTHYRVGKGALFLDKNNQPWKIAGVSWDITEEIRKQKLLEVHLQTIRILSHAHTFAEAIPKLLKIIGETFHLTAITLWIRNDATDLLECKEIWHNHSVNISEFKTACFTHSFAKGEPFPGLIWEEGRDFTMENILEEPEIERKNGMNIAGIQTLFGFPIKDHAEITGVVEFFMDTPLGDQLHQYCLDLSDLLGPELGQFLLRIESEQSLFQLASIVEFAGELIVSLDLEGKITTWNRGAEQMLGYLASEMIGMPMEKIFPPDKKDKLKIPLERIRQGIIVENLEMTYLKKNGDKISVFTTFSPIKNKNIVIGSCTIAQDITELKEFQNRLIVSEEKFRVFVETTSDWIWAIDHHRKITFTNSSIKTTLGYEKEDILGTDLLLLVNEEDRHVVENELAQFISKKKGWVNRTVRWKHKKGEIKWLESSAQPIINEEGVLIGFRGAERDVTERIALEKIKNEFISMASHELRTPLTSISGAVGLLIGKPMDEEKSMQLLAIARNNCDRLIRVVNDILEIGRIEAGKFEVLLIPVDLNQLVKEAVLINKPMIDKFEDEVILDLLQKEATVFSDPNRIMQVISNLLSNALKFSPKKSKIFIQITEQPTTTRVSITDSGPGIPEDLQPRIFEKFSRGEVAISSGIPGAGLGLSIVKSIIDRLGGTINYHTTKEKGTTFYFELPRWKENEQ